jgi:hypothetical protein
VVTEQRRSSRRKRKQKAKLADRIRSISPQSSASKEKASNSKRPGRNRKWSITSIDSSILGELRDDDKADRMEPEVSNAASSRGHFVKAQGSADKNNNSMPKTADKKRSINQKAGALARKLLESKMKQLAWPSQEINATCGAVASSIQFGKPSLEFKSEEDFCKHIRKTVMRAFPPESGMGSVRDTKIVRGLAALQLNWKTFYSNDQ